MAARVQRSPCAHTPRAGLRAAALLSLYVGTAALRAGGEASRQQTLRVPVMTYNVLAPRLSTKAEFAEAEAKVPESTTAEVRWPKVLRYVKTAMAAEAVIALQEVELESWVPRLKDVFENNSYGWTGRAGFERNGFMGVMLAWPNKYLYLGDVHQDLADHAQALPQGKELAWKAQKPFKQHNPLLSVTLQSKENNQKMTFATCHMPVLFGSPEELRAQAIHMNLALLAHQQLAILYGSRSVLMGDFNFMPDSAQYALAADGYELAAKSHPDTLGGLQPTGPMRSAYRECFGAEPKFTNNQRRSSLNTSFVGTLDYIWMGDGVTARECQRLPDEVEGPLPNEREGSDHVPLVAMLDVGSPTGPWPDMPEVGDADIAGTFEGLVKKWRTLKYKQAGKVIRTDHKFEETLKKNYMKTLSTDDESQSPRSDDQQEQSPFF